MDVQFMEVFSKFAETVLIGILPVLAALVAAWLAQKIKEVRRRIAVESPEIDYWLDIATHLAVKAAEQSELAGYVGEKKDWAVSEAVRYLDSIGIKLDLETIEMAIEAAVWDEFNKDNPAKNKNLPVKNKNLPA